MTIVAVVPGDGVKASSPDRCNILWDLDGVGETVITYERWD